jgi:hypothetical protein
MIGGDLIHSRNKASEKKAEAKDWMSSHFLRKQRYSPIAARQSSWSIGPNISYGSNQVQRRRTSLDPTISTRPNEPHSQDNDNRLNFRRSSLINVNQPFSDWIEFEDPYTFVFPRWEPRYVVVDESGILIYDTDGLDKTQVSSPRDEPSI